MNVMALALAMVQECIRICSLLGRLGSSIHGEAAAYVVFKASHQDGGQQNAGTELG